MKRSLSFFGTLSIVLAAAIVVGLQSARAIDCTFRNPLIALGQDPSVVYQDDAYYLVQSTASGLMITRSETITGLGSAQPQLVYAPPPGEAYSYDLWAPELAYLDGEWYLYVAATNAPGNNASHRMFALQADSDDPLGTWTMRGQLAPPDSDFWAIDGSVFQWDDQYYMVWSGWPTTRGDFPQVTYIAPMSDPLTITGSRVLISEPDQAWERSVAAIQEGQQPFAYDPDPAVEGDERFSIVYSADASWMPAYKLGVLSLTGEDPLDPAAWTKVGPVFDAAPQADPPIYGLGHNSSPILSPDGSEWWFLYHAKMLEAPGWQDRYIRAQEFTWSADGLPTFADPPALLEVPAGEPCGLVAQFDRMALPTPAPNSTALPFVDTGSAYVRTQGSFSVAARVRLADTAADYAFVSQDGGLTSNFVLGLAEGRLAFTLYESFGGNFARAHAETEPTAGEWVNVVGVYDAAAQKLSLYIDGVLAGEASFSAVWDSQGSTILGAARQRSQRVGVFNGELENVRIFNGALSAEEAATLE